MIRDEALYKVKGYLTDIIPEENYLEVEEIIKALEQESKTGKWIYNMDNESISELWNCSECGQWSFAKTNYCPNCGAKMAEGEEDD